MTTDMLSNMLALRGLIEALPQTGSRAYGLTHCDDDDRMAETEQAKAIAEEIKSLGLPYTEQGLSIKVTLGGITYNILSLTEQQIVAWKACTRAIRAMADDYDQIVYGLIEDKANRTELFGLMRVTLYAMLRRATPQPINGKDHGYDN